MAEVPVMPRRYTLSTLGVAYHCRCRTAPGAFAAFWVPGANSPVFGLPQQACRYSDREDRCCGCFVLQKTVHRLIYGSASTSVREVRISSISSPVTGGRVRPTWCASSRYKGWGGANAAHRGWWRRSIRFRGSRESAMQDLLAAAGWEGIRLSRQRGQAARNIWGSRASCRSGGWSLPVPSAGGGGPAPRGTDPRAAIPPGSGRGQSSRPSP